MKSLFKKIAFARIMIMERGLGYVLYYAIFRLFGKRPAQHSHGGVPSQGSLPSLFGVDPLIHLRFILPTPFESPPEVACQNGQATINWLIPNFGIGSGGHLNIFRFISFLELQGWQCRLVLVGEHPHSNPRVVETIIRKHFLPIKARVYLRPQDMPKADIGIATSWETAYPLRDWQSCLIKTYFVQDFECDFFPRSSHAIFAEQTYKFGFIGLTAGDWLAKRLCEYGMRTYSFGFSYDKSLYHTQTLRRKTRRLFYYSRPPTPRRGFELGLLAIEKVVEAMPEVEIVMAGWDLTNYRLSFPHQSLGIVPIKDLPELYNSCDVCLVLSLTNMSLLPLELFACGCAVVSNNLPSVTWCLNNEIAELANTDPEALAQACVRMLNDDNYRWQKAQKAYNFAMQTDWEREANSLGKVLHNLLINEDRKNSVSASNPLNPITKAL